MKVLENGGAIHDFDLHPIFLGKYLDCEPDGVAVETEDNKPYLIKVDILAKVCKDMQIGTVISIERLIGSNRWEIIEYTDFTEAHKELGI